MQEIFGADKQSLYSWLIIAVLLLPRRLMDISFWSHFHQFTNMLMTS